MIGHVTHTTDNSVSTKGSLYFCRRWLNVNVRCVSCNRVGRSVWDVKEIRIAYIKLIACSCGVHKLDSTIKSCYDIFYTTYNTHTRARARTRENTGAIPTERFNRALMRVVPADANYSLLGAHSNSTPELHYLRDSTVPSWSTVNSDCMLLQEGKKSVIKNRRQLYMTYSYSSDMLQRFC